MHLITLLQSFKLQSVKFIPNQQLRFLYIQPGKLPNQLTLLTSIPELSSISTLDSIFTNSDTSIGFLFNDSAEILPITKVTCIDTICTELESPTSFDKPLLYLESYLDGYRLTYSKLLLPHPLLLNYIQFGDPDAN